MIAKWKLTKEKKDRCIARIDNKDEEKWDMISEYKVAKMLTNQELKNSFLLSISEMMTTKYTSVTIIRTIVLTIMITFQINIIQM